MATDPSIPTREDIAKIEVRLSSLRLLEGPNPTGEDVEHTAADIQVLILAARQAVTLREAMQDIHDYWDRSTNPDALVDACWHAVDVAGTALGGEQ